MTASNPTAGRSRTTDRSVRIRSTMATPAEDARIERLPHWARYGAAVVAPTAVALALIPFRDELQAAAAVILIVPVVVVALLGGTGPAVVAAVAAGASFGVLLTQPYGRFAIHDRADIVATVVLLLVGVVVGITAVRENRYASRAELRRDELERVLAFAELSAANLDADELIDAARTHLGALLQLRSCTWHDGTRTGDRPLLLDDGQIMGYVRALPADRSRLPDTGVDLLAQATERELGHFLLIPLPGSTTSVEQRRTAAGIANLLALALERTGRPAGPDLGRADPAHRADGTPVRPPRATSRQKTV